MTRPIELRYLRLLTQIADTGSLTAAARALGYSQPAASQQLRALERAVGTPLVLRTAKRMRLTQAGEVLVRHAEVIIRRLALAEQEVAAISDLRSGVVRLACFPTASATILPRALAEMAERHPGISFSLEEMEPPESLDRLRDGSSDIVVGYHHGEDEEAIDDDLLYVPLLDDEFTLAFSENHPALPPPDQPVPLTALQGSRWIAGCVKCRRHLVDACAAAGFEPDIAFETDDYVALLNLVAVGMGTALLPSLMLSTVHIDQLELRALEPAPVRSVGAYSTRELATVPAVAATLQALTKSAEGFARSACRRSAGSGEPAGDGPATVSLLRTDPTG